MTNPKAIYKSYLQMSSEKVAEQFGISSQTVRNIVKKIDPNAIRKPGRKPSSKYVETIRPQDWEELEGATADRPITAQDIQRLNEVVSDEEFVDYREIEGPGW